MREKLFNQFAYRNLEKFIVIALFLAVGAIGSICSAASTAILDAGFISVPFPSAANPVWGKLVVSGNTVTCYYARGAATPILWTQIGTTQTVGFINNPVLVGVFFTSNSATVVGGATIDNFSISPTPTYRLADYDIGAPSLMGSANLINGVWNLTGGGAGTSTFDQFNFQSWLVWGDCIITCRVTGFLSTYYNQKVGIMIRDGFNSGSDFAMFCAKQNGYVDYQYRPAFKDNPDITQFVAPPAPGVKSSVAVGYGLTGGTTYTLRP